MVAPPATTLTSDSAFGADFEDAETAPTIAGDCVLSGIVLAAAAMAGAFVLGGVVVATVAMGGVVVTATTIAGAVVLGGPVGAGDVSADTPPAPAAAIIAPTTADGSDDGAFVNGVANITHASNPPWASRFNMASFQSVPSTV
jgi:hypothetical protein